MFKKHFKYYKSRCPAPSYDNVVDFKLHANNLSEKVLLRTPHYSYGDSSCFSKYGLVELTHWKIFEFIDKPGLMFVVNPFTSKGQQYWVQRCLQDYTKKPNRLNLDPFDELKPGENLWEICHSDKERGEKLLNKLRWATLGYHHNWDTKVYSEEAHDEFPSDLAELSKLVVTALFGPAGEGYQAEAAIINFYHLDSTLSGHKDISEPDISSPLLSVSFGQSAIFLVGGTSLDDPVTAMFLYSGDIVVMSGEARQCYHGVPRIILCEDKPWADDCWEYTSYGKYLESARINMNVRKVLPSGGQSIQK